MTALETHDSLPLFRTEALEAAVDRLGRPVNPLGLSSWLLTCFFIATTITVIGFLVVGKYTRKETVSGRITLNAGSPRIVSSRFGILESVRVIEGQRIQKGEVLFTVATDAMLPQGGRLGETLAGAIADQGEAKLKELTAQLNRVNHQSKELIIRRQGLGRRVRRAQREVSLQQERVSLSEVTVRDLKPLHESQQIAAIQYRQYEAALLDAKQGLSALERELETSIAEIEALGASQSVLGAERSSLAARIEAEMAIQKERRANLDGDRHFALTAPVSGVVTALTAQTGAPVVPNNTLAVIVPENTALQVELWIPSRAIGFIRIGQPVHLMYDAFPYERFGFGVGSVISVSTAPIPPADLAGTMEATEPLFRVQVSVNDPMVRAYGEKWPLTPGMRLAADMVLEERSFLDWILDPLRAASLRS